MLARSTQQLAARVRKQDGAKLLARSFGCVSLRLLLLRVVAKCDDADVASACTATV